MKALFSFLFTVSVVILVVFGAQALIRDLSELTVALVPSLFQLALVAGLGLLIATAPEGEEREAPPAEKPPAEEEPEE